MSNGSMQFLGRQLSEQAEKLGNLVILMSEMIEGIDASIPKYAEPSDVIQKVLVGEEKAATYAKFTSFINGTIRIKGEFFYDSSTNGNIGFKVVVNGTAVSTMALYQSWETKTVDIIIKEGDEVGFGAQMKLRNVNICYNKIRKPDISIL